MFPVRRLRTYRIYSHVPRKGTLQIVDNHILRYRCRRRTSNSACCRCRVLFNTLLNHTIDLGTFFQRPSFTNVAWERCITDSMFVTLSMIIQTVHLTLTCDASFKVQHNDHISKIRNKSFIKHNKSH